MKFTRTFTVALAALVLGAVPAVAVAGGHGKSGAPGQTKTTTNATPNTPSTTSSQTKAFGKYCQNESKTQVAGQNHVKGQGKGTAYSRWITAVAKLRS